MAKNKQKKRKNTSKPMLIDETPGDETTGMDTSEVTINVAAVGSGIVKRSKGQRRAQRLRKEKAIEKALSLMDKTEEKSQKTQLKAVRVSAVKGLY
ncbi:hypothetical protein KP509_10G007200 [Ceratopteris richardii]|uniref:Uncharacterized protein n=1 Tax=Ceratopteris richardii TaxID=49495 RepID=A0A8T2TY61_CERRI|nr:hypothetical protein KP509_10G007200 [Ceratopteris richardii]